MKLKHQAGNAMVALIAIVVLLGGIALAAFMSYKSAYDYGNKMDNELEAIYDNNKNIYAQGTQTVLEIAQVPAMYAEDFKKIVEADIQGRYGKDGLKAVSVFMNEHDIKMDGGAVEMYKEIQPTIKAFRAKFEVNQTKMIDVTRSYKTAQGSLWQGFWLRIAGYPKVDMNKFKPITTDRTENVYKAGKEDGPLKLR
jgi:hypothetical protein